jgi:alkanesulfonate monooxygenase SsuD/methylene tetrahydromethanopterin reductase-like flavin-dependent oxidoreductase (luciferase family)
VQEFRPLLEEGAQKSGRSLDDFMIAPSVQVLITDDEAAAHDIIRPFVALYVGGMGSREKNFYNALVTRYGFEEEAKEVQDLYLEGKKDEAAARLSRELLDTVSLVGPKEKVREKLQVYREAGVHTLGATPLAFDKDGRMEQLRLLAELNAA